MIHGSNNALAIYNNGYKNDYSNAYNNGLTKQWLQQWFKETVASTMVKQWSFIVSQSVNCRDQTVRLRREVLEQE